MKVQRRHIKLIEAVRANSRISVEDLARCLATSRETIRRDLTTLAKQGKIRKVHGGATMPEIFGEGPFQQRLSQNASAKMRIATLAAGLFSPGESLFVDTGSTTLYFAEELALKSGLTVITNSAEIASIISRARNGNRTYLLGGEFSPDNRQTIGTMVTDQLRIFRAHHAVLTIGALDAYSGIMDYDIEEAQVAQAMIGQSKGLTVLVDRSKFDRLASFGVCPLERISRLVCDAPPPDEISRKITAAGGKIILAEPV